MLQQDILEIATRIHTERFKRKMTQEEFSKMLGISKPTLNNLENGRLAKIQVLEEVLLKLNIKVRLLIVE